MCGKFVNVEQYRKLVLPKGKDYGGGASYRERIITPDNGFKTIGGGFNVVLPGKGGDYHFHTHQDSVLIIIGGEGTRLLEGKEFKVKAGDIIMIAAKEKHKLRNTGTTDLKYFEFKAPINQPDSIKINEK